MYELYDSITALLGLLEESKKVANNTGVEALELSTLTPTSTSLAQQAFSSESSDIPIVRLAEKEAYDLVVSAYRVKFISEYTRGQYYEMASSEYDKDKNYLNYLKYALDEYVEAAGSI